MPQDGSNNYYYPPGTPGVPDTTIESDAYNTFLDDLVANDLNIARPIHRGGTGATTAAAALSALGAEKAMQNVTNYDSHAWITGSFYADGAATNAPTAGPSYSGICLVTSADYITVEAYNLTTTAVYTRQKVAGVWGAWVQRTGTIAEMDARYVNLTGDTMTGELITKPSSGTIAASTAGSAGTLQVISTAGAGNGAFMTFHNPALFAFNFGMDADTKLKVGGFSLGANAYEIYHQGNFNPANYLPLAGGTLSGALIVAPKGSTFGTPAGTAANAAMPITDANILIYNAGPTSWAGIGADGSGNMWFRTGTGGTPAPAFYVDTSQYINLLNEPTAAKHATTKAYTDTKLPLTGGPSAPITGDLHISSGGTNVGVIRFGTGGGANYLHWDGTVFNFSGDVRGAKFSASTSFYLEPSFYMAVSGSLRMISFLSSYYFGCEGANGNFYLNSDGGAYSVWRRSDMHFIHYGPASKPGGGVWGDSSDSRIKNVEGEYTRGLAEVAQLRPIFYTFKGNDTNEPPANLAIHTPPGEEAPPDTREAPTVPYPNSMHVVAAKAGTKYAGLIAQEVETIMPEMITKKAGYIDGEPVTDLRDMDTSPLIFALINAVKELKARVEQLENPT